MGDGLDVVPPARAVVLLFPLSDVCLKHRGSLCMNADSYLSQVDVVPLMCGQQSIFVMLVHLVDRAPAASDCLLLFMTGFTTFLLARRQ